MTKDGVSEREKYYISTKNISLTVWLQNMNRGKYRVDTERKETSVNPPRIPSHKLCTVQYGSLSVE
jgi:hypothetical protein